MKKTLITVVLTAVVCFAIVGTTLAWLMDKTDPITNTFTVGDVDIDLTETANPDLKMVPGKTLAKDPKVTVNAGSERCWVFVKIEETNNLDDFIEYSIAANWAELTAYPGVYWIEVSADDASAGVTYPVLLNNQVEVKTDVTKAMLDAVTEATRPQLIFTAYAVQYAENDIDTAAEAWAIASATTTP